MIERYAQFCSFIKWSGTSFSATCVYGFSRKAFSREAYIPWPFLGHWATCALQLFVSHSVTPKILKLTLSFLSSYFLNDQISQDKTQIS